jgi:hypothetical protein
MKKYISLIFPIFLISFVRAEDCGITNLASCISQKFFEFLLSILNAPIQPILDVIYNLMIQPVNIDIFFSVWTIIIYILSMFYGLLLLYSGFKFVLSGHSPEQREKAKSTLTRIILLMVFVQASFYIYSLIIEMNSSVTTAIFNLVQQNFFLLTIDNITNIGLEFMLLLPYILCLVITLIILVLRYIIVSSGVILFAIGIFFYFIQPLNNYGKLIINFLLASITSTFFYSIIFLASSKLLEIAVFQNFKILVMIGAFSFVNILTIIVLLFIIIKAATAVLTPVVRVMSLVGAVTGG